MDKKYIIGIDEGTTSTRAILYDTKTFKIVDKEQIKFEQIFPFPSRVEQNASDVYKKVELTLNTIIKRNNLTCDNVYGIAITNQRETVVAWDRTSGKPIYNAIGWQCRRTSEYCKRLKNKTAIKNKTGLIVDAYFSASKINWLLKNCAEAKALEKQDNLCFGTMDSFIIYKLTKGKSFVTDVTNASRTMLFNINTLSWDEKLLKQFGIKQNCLPCVLPCASDFGMAKTIIGELPILSVMGDQQAALFGHGCFEEGMIKATYGTGCFVLMNTGNTPYTKNKKMLSTIAWQIDDKVTYALEGSVFNAGSALEWGNRLGLFKSSSETSDLAQSVENNMGVYMVPAFNGLGAPYWNSSARGIICGITGGVTKAHISRAILESMAYSTYDIVKAMENKNIKIKEIRCDGGVSKNNFLLQFQSDLVCVKLLRQQSSEVTAMGTIFMAGLKAKVFKNLNDISKHINFESEWMPKMNTIEVNKLIIGWHKAIKKSL